MYDDCSKKVSVVINNPISVKVVEKVELPVVKVLVPGVQGPASVDRPLDVDPLFCCGGRIDLPIKFNRSKKWLIHQSRPL